MKPTALITGASSGIGLELARLFARDGYDLVLVARNQAALERLAGELRAQHQAQVTVLVQDLALPGAAESVFRQVQARALAVDVLVNNAGTQVYSPFAPSDLAQTLALLQVNISTLVHLTHLCLPGMLQRGHGRILNLGSIGSFVPGPLNSVYCASKAFVLSFSEAIAAELSHSGVSVTALCPGPTDTAFVTRHSMQGVRLFRHTMSPQRVAQIGYRALQAGRPLVIPGLGNQLEVLFFQLAAPFVGLLPPKVFMAIGGWVMGRGKSNLSRP
ncbi:MAG: SDR family oxidoreductase [Chloroflexi bacterium]|jgi:short-subunit dehydrogenase|nr:SDR family oxidoreductase [Chloroflexota bacterium]